MLYSAQVNFARADHTRPTSAVWTNLAKSTQAEYKIPDLATVIIFLLYTSIFLFVVLLSNGITNVYQPSVVFVCAINRILSDHTYYMKVVWQHTIQNAQCCFVFFSACWYLLVTYKPFSWQNLCRYIINVSTGLKIKLFQVFQKLLHAVCLHPYFFYNLQNDNI